MDQPDPERPTRPFGMPLRPYQVAAVMGLLKGVHRLRGVTFTVMFPRQSGKNEVSAAFVAGLLRMNAQAGGSVVVCAPTLHPQAGISMERTLRRLRVLDHMAPDGTVVRVEGNVLRAGRASAVFLSASPAAHVAGHTASLAIVGDEAQDIDQEWFDRQFRPMAASTGAPTVLFGTPWNGETLLERSVGRNVARDKSPSRPGGIAFHHTASWEEVETFSPAYGAYVRSERERLGEHHPLFLSQYELRASENAGRLFRREQLAAMEGTHAALSAPEPGVRYVAGLDLGGDGEGADASVLTIARASEGRCEVVAHLSWQGVPFLDLEHELEIAFRAWRFERVSVDNTGLGAPLAARLEALFGETVERFTFTAASKAELGWGMLAAASTGRLRLYADDGSDDARECRRQLRFCQSHRRGGLGLSWGSEAGDDYVTSLALCVRASQAIGAPRIAVGRRRG